MRSQHAQTGVITTSDEGCEILQRSKLRQIHDDSWQRFSVGEPSPVAISEAVPIEPQKIEVEWSRDVKTSELLDRMGFELEYSFYTILESHDGNY